MEKLLRILLLLVGAVLELMLVMALFHFFTNFAWIDLILRLLSIVLVITIINNSLHLSFDMMWILIILLFPVPGTMLYFLLGANLISSQTTRSLVRTTAASQKYFQQDDNTIRSLEKELPSLAGDIHYLSKAAGFPVYHNTGYDYYPLGDDGYPVMLAEMRKAKKFIFLEYFIIERGVMWDGMMQILKRRRQRGWMCALCMMTWALCQPCRHPMQSIWKRNASTAYASTN